MLWSIFNQDIINNYNYINNEQIHNCFSFICFEQHKKL